MRNFIIIAIVLFISILLFVLLLRKNVDKQNDSKNVISNISNEEVDQKIKKAIAFLKGKVDTTYLFRDPYLMCIDQVKECESNWRVLLLAQNISYDKYEDEIVQEIPDFFILAKRLEESEYKKVKTKPFNNYPLEIYCNFSRGHPENVNLITQIMKNYDSEISGWIHIERYRKEWQWRKIWDESFCTAALADYQDAYTVISKVLENHHNVWLQAQKKKVANLHKYTSSFLWEILYLYKKKELKLEQSYIDFLKNYFTEIRQKIKNKAQNAHNYAIDLLYLIKDFPAISDENLGNLIKECLLTIINGIDEDGKLPVIMKDEKIKSNNIYLSYTTINTLMGLNLIFYFRKIISYY